MKFEWDGQKNKANIRKHGIDFDDAKKMFNNPMLVRLDTRDECGEDRWIGIGFLGDIVAVVVFTERGDEAIRIISARKALSQERKNYEEEIRHQMEKIEWDEG